MAWARRMIGDSEFSKTWKVTNLRLYPHPGRFGFELKNRSI
jgi:hypothetical protein